MIAHSIHNNSSALTVNVKNQSKNVRRKERGLFDLSQFPTTATYCQSRIVSVSAAQYQFAQWLPESITFSLGRIAKTQMSKKTRDRKE